jgi:hypothetical protein
MSKTKQQKADAAKNARLKRFFRIDLEDYKKVEAYEQEHCPVLLGTTRRALDHQHQTGQLRGILDWRINRALGLVENAFHEDTPKVLQSLAWYLMHFPVTTVLGPRYGIIGKAKKKKVMIYGSPTGPIKPAKKARK